MVKVYVLFFGGMVLFTQRGEGKPKKAKNFVLKWLKKYRKLSLPKKEA